MLQDYSGPRLKQLRKRARLTQMQVVKETGVSEATICYLERGDRKPQSKTLEKLLSLYAIETPWDGRCFFLPRRPRVEVRGLQPLIT